MEREWNSQSIRLPTMERQKNLRGHVWSAGSRHCGDAGAQDTAQRSYGRYGACPRLGLLLQFAQAEERQAQGFTIRLLLSQLLTSHRILRCWHLYSTIHVCSNPSRRRRSRRPHASRFFYILPFTARKPSYRWISNTRTSGIVCGGSCGPRWRGTMRGPRVPCFCALRHLQPCE